MDTAKINEMWAEDVNINRNNLTEETLKTARLHQKYLDMLLKAKNLHAKNQYELSKLKIAKYRYYRGEMTKPELESHGWSQYQGLRPLKSDMQFMLDNDADLAALSLKVTYITNIIYQLESIMQQIRNRDWAIKNHIEWQKFISGN